MDSILSVPWPGVVLLAGGVLLVGLGPAVGGKSAPPLASLVVLLAAGTSALFARGATEREDDVLVTVSLWGTLLLGTLFVLLSFRTPGRCAHDAGDHGLALMMLAGALAAGAAKSLPVAVAGLHLVALCLHAFAWRRRIAPARGAVLSAWLFHSACLLLILLGLVTLYGAGGSLSYAAIAAAGRGEFAAPDFVPLPRSIALVSAVSLLAGLCGFAVTHAIQGGRSTLLDACTGSAVLLLPLPAWTAMLVVLRVGPFVLGAWTESAVTVMVLAAWLLMLGGGVLGLGQRRILPRLACTLAAHFGLWLVGTAVGAWETANPGKGLAPSSGLPGGAAAALFCLCADGLALLALLAVIATLRRGDASVEFTDDVAGLCRQRPVAGVAALVSLASLCGVPPLPGFWGRWWLLTAAFSPQQPSSLTGLYEPHFGFLATCGVMILGWVLVAAVYLRLLQQIVLEEPRGRLEPAAHALGRWSAGFLAFAVLLIGVWPQPLLRFSTRILLPEGSPQSIRPASEHARPEPNTDADAQPGPRQSAHLSPGAMSLEVRPMVLQPIQEVLAPLAGDASPNSVQAGKQIEELTFVHNSLTESKRVRKIVLDRLQGDSRSAREGGLRRLDLYRVTTLIIQWEFSP